MAQAAVSIIGDLSGANRVSGQALVSNGSLTLTFQLSETPVGISRQFCRSAKEALVSIIGDPSWDLQ